MIRVRMPGEFDLMAYADGRIDPESSLAREIEQYLAGHPEKRRHIDVIRRQNQALRRHFSPIMAAPVPRRLWPETIRASRIRRRNRIGSYGAAAAIVGALLTLCLPTTWQKDSGVPTEQASADAVIIEASPNAEDINKLGEASNLASAPSANAAAEDVIAEPSAATNSSNSHAVSESTASLQEPVAMEHRTVNDPVPVSEGSPNSTSATSL